MGMDIARMALVNVLKVLVANFAKNHLNDYYKGYYNYLEF
jgi:hypothetical protein